MDITELVEEYLGTWNETDPTARRAAVAAIWAEGARYVDPLASVAGHDQIAGLIGAAQGQVPGHAFRLAGGVDAHHDVARFTWELVPAAGGDPVAIGFDVAVIGDGGRITSVVGFLDRAPGS